MLISLCHLKAMKSKPEEKKLDHVDSYSSMKPTNNPIRDKCREMLLRGLQTECKLSRKIRKSIRERKVVKLYCFNVIFSIFVILQYMYSVKKQLRYVVDAKNT